MNITFFIILTLTLGWSWGELIQVDVAEGTLEGQVLVPSTGKGQYYSFKGIPYAAPPVGDLRFRAPEPPLKWEGVRNATVHGSVCVQYESVTSLNIIGSEDCLFLNVYTPNLKPDRIMPVMFFIHGGGFLSGSGNDDFYAPDFLMGYDVVLVTINYRLDAIGFLSVGTEEVPGNAGMKDQITAMLWVQKNIRNFGGDPNQMTLFGQSAGGASVSLHLVSPAAKGLFRRGVAMSGVIFNEFAITFQPERRAFTLGSRLGLDTEDPNELIEFLRSLPPERLIKVRPAFLISDQISNALFTTIYFTPVVEKKFGNGSGQYLTDPPTLLLCRKQINNVDFMLGYTSQEGQVTSTLDVILNYYRKYQKLLVPLKISYNRSPAKVLELSDQIQHFYFGNQTISYDTIREFFDYYSVSHFNYDIHAFIERLPKLPATRRFAYVFRIYSSRNVYSRPAAEMFGIMQATHKDDLPYLFDGSGYNLTVDVNSEVFKYVDLMCTLYTNFAKYGNPTPDDSLGAIWPEYDPGRRFLIIGKTGELTPMTISYTNNKSLGFFHQLYMSVGINL